MMSDFKINSTKKLTVSALIIALYVVIMFCTQSFASGAVQVRIATALYSLSYVFPFLVLPLGVANLVSNVLGGMGVVDMLGGCGVGIVTSFCVYMVKRLKLPFFLAFVPIVLGPGLIVPIWLSYFTGVPYLALVASLCAGQIAPAVLGVAMIKVFDGNKILSMELN